MKEFVFDFEGDGLEPTKIHVLSYLEDENIVSLYEPDQIRQLMISKYEQGYWFIGHNVILFDLRELSRLLNYDFSVVQKIDTLALSWYLEPGIHKHGLEEYGKLFGEYKIDIQDWYGLSREEYTKRCEQDVKITKLLWDQQKHKLLELYEKSDNVKRLIKYLEFKLDCASLQLDSKWKLDVNKTKQNLMVLQDLKRQKEDALRASLPRVPRKTLRRKPAKQHRKDGSETSRWKTWLSRLEDNLLPQGTLEFEDIVDYDDPNPSSHQQIKDWLLSIGWKPCTFKTGANGEVPQITELNSSELTPSVLLLKDQHPEIEALEGLFTLNHRIGLLEGFLENQRDGYLRAEIAGLTNTLRFKHSKIVNLPGVNKLYGEYIRGCLVADQDYEICGADMVALEDRTKQHYIYPHDPEYVEEMSKPGFEPHLDIALQGGLMTGAEVEQYKQAPKDNKPKDLSLKRHGAKTTNYAATYKAGPPKIARTANISLQEAKLLHQTYWKRNWAILEVEKQLYVKELSNGERWLLNPVSGFYYNLRNDKDRFSTLNQGTGSYCFDVWLSKVLEKRRQLTAQFHDEGVWHVRRGYRNQMTEVLETAIKETNDVLNLNRKLDITIQFGNSYGEVH